MKTLSIGITTFRNRLSEVKKLIKDIRQFDTNIDILLTINTNYNEKMPNDYRKDLLSFCCQYDNIYPLTFPRYTGLSKMLNNLIVHCPTTHIFLMGDDTTFTNSMALLEIRNHIQTKEIFHINWGFGTFVISKKLIYEIGYFDERLISYSYEDGDFLNRYTKPIEKIIIPGIINRIQNRLDHSYDKNIECYIADGGHKSVINKKIIDIKMEEKWPDIQQYPYEMFIEDNRHNIGKFTEINKNNIQ